MEREELRCARKIAQELGQNQDAPGTMRLAKALENPKVEWTAPREKMGGANSKVSTPASRGSRRH